MKIIQCEDCGKHYDYDEDAFCPKCGAFNQPSKSELIQMAENRVDGLNEEGHAGSFAHREFHREERERRHKGLDKSGPSLSGEVPAPKNPLTRQNSGRRSADSGKATWWNIVIILIGLFAALMKILSE